MHRGLTEFSEFTEIVNKNRKKSEWRIQEGSLTPGGVLDFIAPRHNFGSTTAAT